MLTSTPLRTGSRAGLAPLAAINPAAQPPKKLLRVDSWLMRRFYTRLLRTRLVPTAKMCHIILYVSHRFQAAGRLMKTLSIRQMRSALTRLDDIVAKEGEILVTRRGRAVARLLPARPARRMPSHANLRAAMPRLPVGSEVLVREDRNGR